MSEKTAQTKYQCNRRNFCSNKHRPIQQPNAPSLQTASNNQNALIEFSANSSAVTSTQQQQPLFSVANMSTSVENNQNLSDYQQKQATVFPQTNFFAALPFPPTNFNPQTHNNTVVYTAHISSSTTTQTSRLTKIKLDKYDGDPVKLNMWYGLIQATVHSQPMSDAEKLTHLQILTTGSSYQAIAGYSCNSAMYATAHQEFELQFRRPANIVNNYINKLQQLRMPSTQYKQSFTDFQLSFAISRKHFRHLDSPST